VLVDRERRIARVTAQPIEGASLASYRELERRVSAEEPQWSIRLRPPAQPLPAISFSGGKPTEEGARALDLVAWTAQRVGDPIALSGPNDEVQFVAESLVKRGITVRTDPGGRGPVTAKWGTPGA